MDLQQTRVTGPPIDSHGFVMFVCVSFYMMYVGSNGHRTERVSVFVVIQFYDPCMFAAHMIVASPRFGHESQEEV